MEFLHPAMPATMKLLFEVADLNNASPATVSRMGMVFMGKDALGWHPVVEAWAKNLCITNDPQWSELTRPDEDAGIIKQFMFKNVGGMLLFLQDHCESVRLCVLFFCLRVPVVAPALLSLPRHVRS